MISRRHSPYLILTEPYNGKYLRLFSYGQACPVEKYSVPPLRVSLGFIVFVAGLIVLHRSQKRLMAVSSTKLEVFPPPRPLCRPVRFKKAANTSSNGFYRNLFYFCSYFDLI